MPFALLIIGIVLIVVAVRGTQETFVHLVGGDFSGPGNFFYWVAALVLVGSVGYVPKLKPISDGLLVAILLGLILSRGNPKFPGGGFFQQFQDALAGTETKQPGAGGGSFLDWLSGNEKPPNVSGATPSPGDGGSTIWTFPGGGRIRIDPRAK